METKEKNGDPKCQQPGRARGMSIPALQRIELRVEMTVQHKTNRPRPQLFGGERVFKKSSRSIHENIETSQRKKILNSELALGVESGTS